MKNILDKYPEISDQLKRKVAENYFWRIKLKLSTLKNKHIRKLKKREDIHQILAMGIKDKDEEIAAIDERFHINKGK